MFSHDPSKVHFRLTTGCDFWFLDFVAGRMFRVVNEEVLPATRPAEVPTHAVLAHYLVPASATRVQSRLAGGCGRYPWCVA